MSAFCCFIYLCFFRYVVGAKKSSTTEITLFFVSIKNQVFCIKYE